jgi:GDP-mannose 6-dehydrogenase
LSSHLCESIDAVIARSDVIVIGNGAPEFSEAIANCRADQTIIDLVRIPIDFSTLQAQYDGICW